MAMMCGGGGGAELSPEDKKRNDAATKIAESVAQENTKPIKMLLLGAGESGKSTIFKQMKVINKDGYSRKELEDFKGIVHGNVIVSVNSMMEAFDELEEPMPGDLKGLWDKFKSDSGITADVVNPDGGALVKQIWMTEGCKKIFGRRNEYQLNDSTEYYCTEIDRIAASDYCPTKDDVLRSRVRTTGIVQSDFKIKSETFAMFDVGGQRNERRKWIHCFDNVDAVVFVASLSEYDQVLFEDKTMNRLDEAINLFDQIVNSKWFLDSSMILVLNKKDLFEIKLKEGEEKGKLFKDYTSKISEKNCPEPYSGPNQMQQCADFTKSLFLAKNKKNKQIYPHVTTAIDTSNVKFVFNAVVAMVLQQNLKASGLA